MASEASRPCVHTLVIDKGPFAPAFQPLAEPDLAFAPVVLPAIVEEGDAAIDGFVDDFDCRHLVPGGAEMVPTQPERGDLRICLTELPKRDHSAGFHSWNPWMQEGAAALPGPNGADGRDCGLFRWRCSGLLRFSRGAGAWTGSTRDALRIVARPWSDFGRAW